MTDNSGFFDNAGGGGGAPSAKLKDLNDWVRGEIVDSFKKDYVPFGKEHPEKNNDGTTRQQLVVILQTDQRNWAGVSKVPADEQGAAKNPSEDDGKRAVYVPERSNIQYAVGRALTTAKAKFENGGTLAVKVANLRDTGKGNPLKEHEAVYTAPVAGRAFFPPAAEAPAQAAPPVQQAAPQAPAAPAQDPWVNSAPAPVATDPFGGQAAGAGAPPF